MKKLYLFIFFLVTTLSYGVNSVYIAQTAQGANTGVDCTDAKAATYFNTSSNWSATPTGIQIGPGTTVYLCGVITTNLTYQGNGSAGGSSVCGYAATACTPVTIDGSQTGAFMDAFIDSGKQYWIIQNVTWGNGSTGTGKGPGLSNGAYATNSSTQAVIQTQAGAAFGSILNNHMDVMNSAQCVFFHGTTHDIAILNNFLRIGTGTGGTYPFYTGGDGFDTDCIDTEGAYNVLIAGNSLEMNIGAGDASCGGCHDDITQVWDSVGGHTYNWTYLNNYFTQNSNSAITNNLSWCEEEGIAQNDVGHWDFIANIFLYLSGGNSGNGCIMDGNYANMTAHIYSNSIIGKSGAGNNLLNLSGAGSFYLSDNIVYGTTQGNSLTGGVTFASRDHNLWFGSPSPSCSGFPTDICGSNPNFNNYAGNDFTLTSGSPAIGAAANLGSSYASYPTPGTTWPNPAISTRPVSGNWDIGVYQFSGSPTAPTVTTTTATSITSSSAQAGGAVTSNGGASVTSEGTCYGPTANPTTPCTNDGTTTPFVSNLTGLTASTLYHYRAFATNSAGTGYGADMTFTTSAPSGTITPSPTSVSFPNQIISTTSSVINVVFTSTYGVTVTIISLSTTGDFAQSNACGGSIAASGTCTVHVIFTPTALGLRSGSLVLVPSLGGTITVPLSGTGIAAPTAPTVTTTTASGITQTTATSGGIVTSNGGSAVTSEGVCVGLSANPTSPCTNDGTATPFTSHLTGLTAATLYHYRAFATNIIGTDYGADMTFTTLNNPTTGGNTQGGGVGTGNFVIYRSTNYAIRTDLNATEPGPTLASLGGLTGSNSQTVDDLGNNTKIIRVTDASYVPSKPNISMQVGIGGSSDTNAFSVSYVKGGHIHYLLSVQDNGGGTYVSDFDSTAFSVSRPYSTSFSFPNGGVDWAYTSYKAYTTPATILQSIDMSDYTVGPGTNPPSAVNVFDYLELTPGLPDYNNNKCLPPGFAGQTWNDDAAHSKDDQTFATAFSWYPDWTATISYPAGTIVRPSVNNSGNWIFYSSGGTSGTGPITWPQVQGNTVTDGSITWTALQSGTGQGTGNMLAVYRVGQGCTILNTTTGAVSGDWGATGTITQSDRTLIHNVKISKDGNWVIIQTTLCGLLNGFATCNAAASPEVWQVGTTNMPPLAQSRQHGGGHWTEGYTHWINGSSFPNPPGVGGYTIRPFSNGSAFRDIYTATQMPALTSPWDGHYGYSNADPLDTVPFVGALDEVSGGVPVYSMGQMNCGGTTTCTWVSGHQFSSTWSGNIYVGNSSCTGSVCVISGTPTATSLTLTSAGPSGNVVFSYAPITIAWPREIQAISPVSGITYRFSHTFVSGEDNWEFDSAFAIGSVSQDNKFWAWTTDYLGTFGSIAGGSSCITTTNCRPDVLIIQLASF